MKIGTHPIFPRVRLKEKWDVSLFSAITRIIP